MLKVGMYVRCPIKDDNVFIKTYHMGQIIKIDKEQETCKVVFHDLYNIGSYLGGVAEPRVYKLRQLKETNPLPNSLGLYNSKKVIILCAEKRDSEEYYHYFIQYKANKEHGIFSVCEKDLQIQFTRTNYNPVNQLVNFELQNPKWYLNRRKIRTSIHMIDNSPYGFTNILGTRVQMFPHQIDTVVRGLTMNSCRLMLADEVGLGKTIEALSIIKGMIERQFNFRALIVVPSSLEYQWQTEVVNKFTYKAPIWGKENIDKTNFVIISYDDLLSDFKEIIKHKWEMIVIDETHKIVRDNSLYLKISELSKSVKHLLLLSATPIMHRGDEYRKLLQLLNPRRFESMDVDTFRELLDKQTYIRDEISELVKDLGDYYTYDLRSNYVLSLTRLSDLLVDPLLKRIVDEFIHADKYHQVEKIKITLSYLAEFYQIDRGVVRHRKRELDNAYIIRGCQEYIRKISDSTLGSIEKKIHDRLMDFLNTDLIIDINIKKQLISSMLSSPFALQRTIACRDLKALKAELAELYSLNNEWLLEVENEISQVSTRASEIYSSKFGSLINTITERDGNSEKFLIFSSFTETAIQIENV
jgi:ATP-dependent helicase HepA